MDASYSAVSNYVGRNDLMAFSPLIIPVVAIINSKQDYNEICGSLA